MTTMRASQGGTTGEHSHDTRELMRRELGAAHVERIERGLFGIALSGGGIRSATFNLGLLQGLACAGMLTCFDYLSTVSGGGYTGAFWSAWRHSNDSTFPQAQAPGTEHRAIRHLREFSNFLSPRLALLSYDTGRLIIAPIAAGVPALVVALAVIITALAAWSGIAWLLLGTGTYVSSGVLAAIVLITLFALEAVWKRREGSAGGSRETAYAAAAVSALALVLLAWRVLGPSSAHFDTRGFPLYTGGTGARPLELFAPALACLATIVVLVLVRAALSRWTSSEPRRRQRSALDRVLARLLFIAALWSVIAALWLAGMALPRLAGTPIGNASWFGALMSTLTGLFLWARRRLERQPNKPFGDSVLARLKPLLPQLLAYAVVTLMILMCVVSLAWWQKQGEWALAFANVSYDPLPAVIGTALGVILAAALLFHPNRVGLHAFYRGRLARAYPGAANPLSQNERVTEDLPGDDFPITDLHRNRPVHLVCCAANDLTPFDPLGSLQRGADSAVLSAHAFSVGSCWRTWTGQSPPTLAAAITASGAAFNSMMGAYSKRFGPASVFLMASLNLRLGRWLRHPHAERRRPDGERILPGILFLKELFGMSSATDDDVHLSDGGHFENMALYELLRRRCRYILAADCGADPDFAFDDVGNLVRRAREDFDIEIRMDLSPLRPGAEGTARQPMVAGDIHYPDGVTGVLLLFKPTLIGTEPADVAQYRSRNAIFPAESTGDQFYDEAQWESYRRLGQFAAETAFGFARRDPELRASAHAAASETETEAAARAARIFARARFEWQPRPPAIEARIADFAGRAAELDARVAASHVALHREVMKEADELRRQTEEAPGEALADSDYATSLRPARGGALFMEQTYYAWDLEATRSQPLSLGVMNFFARWAYAPLFRMWWPVMRSTLTPQFARFMELQFGLERIPPHREGDSWTETIDVVDAAEPGFALQCWMAERAGAGAEIRGSRAGVADAAGRARMIEYRLRLRYRTKSAFQIQAALVRCHSLPEGITYWAANDFYVPPGLWGIGIGDDFLRHLIERFALGDRTIYVRIPAPASADPNALKTIADESQLYRSAGFREFYPGADELVQVAAMGGAGALEALKGSTWLRPILPGEGSDARSYESFSSGPS